jgi:stearoyl-CoA desaturase (delta-9 desaturase)
MPATLQRPESVDDGELFSSNVIAILVLHSLLLAALVPALFSWTGVVLVFLGDYVFGCLGVNLGYHRLLTHRGFRCPKWLEYALALLGVCSLQDSPARWVAIHRMHHQHSDDRPDPHSPLVSFAWGHIGWLFLKNRASRRRGTLERYAGDLLRDRFYARLERHRTWLWVYAAHAALFFGLGCLAGWATTGSPRESLRFGLSLLVWGVFVRTVYVWHITWAVNSVTHRWGYRNYETGDNSRNNWVVALLTHGEGWHNNHHASPRSARHGHRWWEFDQTYATILLLRAVGLATDVAPPCVPGRLKPPPEKPTRRVALARGSVSKPRPHTALAPSERPRVPSRRESADRSRRV